MAGHVCAGQPWEESLEAAVVMEGFLEGVAPGTLVFLLLQAMDTWAQRASQGLPYGQSLQRALHGLRQWEMPELRVPDKLFLKRKGAAPGGAGEPGWRGGAAPAVGGPGPPSPDQPGTPRRESHRPAARGKRALNREPCGRAWGGSLGEEEARPRHRRCPTLGGDPEGRSQAQRGRGGQGDVPQSLCCSLLGRRGRAETPTLRAPGRAGRSPREAVGGAKCLGLGLPLWTALTRHKQKPLSWPQVCLANVTVPSGWGKTSPIWGGRSLPRDPHRPERSLRLLGRPLHAPVTDAARLWEDALQEPVPSLGTAGTASLPPQPQLCQLAQGRVLPKQAQVENREPPNSSGICSHGGRRCPEGAPYAATKPAVPSSGAEDAASPLAERKESGQEKEGGDDRPKPDFLDGAPSAGWAFPRPLYRPLWSELSLFIRDSGGRPQSSAASLPPFSSSQAVHSELGLFHEGFLSLPELCLELPPPREANPSSCRCHPLCPSLSWQRWAGPGSRGGPLASSWRAAFNAPSQPRGQPFSSVVSNGCLSLSAVLRSPTAQPGAGGSLRLAPLLSLPQKLPHPSVWRSLGSAGPVALVMLGAGEGPGSPELERSLLGTPGCRGRNAKAWPRAAFWESSAPQGGLPRKGCRCRVSPHDLGGWNCREPRMITVEGQLEGSWSPLESVNSGESLNRPCLPLGVGVERHPTSRRPLRGGGGWGPLPFLCGPLLHGSPTDGPSPAMTSTSAMEQLNPEFDSQDFRTPSWIAPLCNREGFRSFLCSLANLLVIGEAVALLEPPGLFQFLKMVLASRSGSEDMISCLVASSKGAERLKLEPREMFLFPRRFLSCPNSPFQLSPFLLSLLPSGKEVLSISTALHKQRSSLDNTLTLHKMLMCHGRVGGSMGSQALLAALACMLDPQTAQEAHDLLEYHSHPCQCSRSWAASVKEVLVGQASSCTDFPFLKQNKAKTRLQSCRAMPDSALLLSPEAVRFARSSSTEAQLSSASRTPLPSSQPFGLSFSLKPKRKGHGGPTDPNTREGGLWAKSSHRKEPPVSPSVPPWRSQRLRLEPVQRGWHSPSHLSLSLVCSLTVERLWLDHMGLALSHGCSFSFPSGCGETTYDHRNTFTFSWDGSLRHRLLNSNIKLSHVEKLGNNPASKGFLTFDASSDLGPQASLSVQLESKKKLHVYIKEIKGNSQFTASSFHAKSTCDLSYQRDVSTGQISGESNLSLDSSFLQATNQVTGRFGDGSLSVTSASSLQEGALKNVASLTLENGQVTVKSDTTGKSSDLSALHKLDVTLTWRGALLRSEHQADFQTLKVFGLLSGSLDSRGLELNADLLGTDRSSSGAHKATLRIGRDGLLTSATTNLKVLPLMLEHELNAALGPLGSSWKLMTNARYQENGAKFSVDGKLALTEVALGSVCQAALWGTDSKNVFAFRVNKDGLTLSNDMMGSYKDAKLEQANSLAIGGLSLDFTSKVDGVLSPDKLYQHGFSVQLQPYSLLASLNHNLKYDALDVASAGKLRLEPLKLSLGGNVKGTYGSGEFKHVYSITYADLSASYKTDTIGKAGDSELTHRVSADLAGLASSVDINTAYHSESLHFNNVFHALMEPFKLAVDAHTTGNGRLILHGEHTGQLYSKLLLKAEPLAFTFAHDYKASSGHQLRSRRSLDTSLDHRVAALFTPAEQSSSWKLKALANNNGYNHDLQTYNTDERVGVELRAGATVDLAVLDSPVQLPYVFSEPVNVIDALGLRTAVAEPQEFGLAGSVKYDKNLDVHVVDLPFLESLPAYFEKARGALLASLQALQRYLKSIDVDRHVKRLRAALDRLPQLVTDQLSKLNLEGQVVNVKESLIAFLENSKFTIDDLQISLDNAKISLNEFSSQLQTNLIQFDQYIKDNYDLHKLKESITKLINHIVDTLKSVDERYQIRVLVMKAVRGVYVFVEKLDVSKMGGRAVVWIQKVDSQYQIRAKILEKLQQLSRQIQAVDLQGWANGLKRQIEDIDVRVYLEFLRTSLPIQEIKNVVEHITVLVVNLLEDFGVAEKVGVLQAKIHELASRYEVSKRVQVLMDKLVQLANQHKLKEAIRGLANSLKKIEMKAHFEKLCLLVDEAVKKTQTVKFGQLIDEVNKFLDLLVKTLRSFDYNQFVDEANKTIRELIQSINEEIRALELPQKVEAARRYVAEVRAVLSDYAEKIQDTELTVITDWFWNVLGSTFVVDIRGRFLEVLEDTRDRLYQMDVQKEIQQRLQTLSQVYDTLVNYVRDWWQLIAKEITDFAEQYNIRDWAENLKSLVERGFTVPEIRTALGTLPAFEVSLRALQEATFQTPDFIVPLTDLRIPSVQINMKKLKEVRVPSKFTTPEFTILNTFMVPSFTIDLIEIKLKLIRTIDQMVSSEFRWPLPELSLQDLKVKDTFLAYLTLPDFHFPELTVPEILIPKLSLSEFQVPDLQIPEFQLPRIPQTVVVPTFGKMSAILKITSPFFTLDASGGVENTTASKSSPEMVASVTAEGRSTLDFLDFTFQADAHLSAPAVERMDVRESLKFSSKYLKADHEGSVLFLAASVLGTANTVATVYTDKNTVELSNNLTLKLHKQVAFESDTKYSHKLNLPQMDFSSQTDLRHELAMLLEAGHVAVTSTGKGSWKWAFPRFSDEGTHESQLRFTVEGPMASLAVANKINSKHVKVNQKLASESGFLNFVKFELQSEVESQHVGHSALTARGSVLLGELKAELTGSHEAHLNGRVTGTLKNSLSLLAQPFEIGAEVNNEGNVKVSFPLKLTGKIDFLNNYALVLSCDVQQVSWQSGARFNQYRYSQNFSAGNNERSVEAHVSINGEANLDFLNIPLTIPEMTLPYSRITTPQVTDFSLWERTGLKDFLQTTKQSFDLSVNAQYKKNRDTHAVPFPVGAFYDALYRNIEAFKQHFEKGRDKAFGFLTKSYNEAKVQFEKYKVETPLDKLPRALRVPGYFLPGLNIVVSPFTADMPAFGYTIPREISSPGFALPGTGFSLPSYTFVVPSLEFPVLHVPRSLRKLTLPDFRIRSTSDHLLIPAMGNFTYDFSFKSSVITLNTNMGLYNQSDVVAHFRSSSSSVIEALQYKLDGTTSLTRKRGLKLAMALSLTNRFVEGKHDSTISLTKRNMEASVSTTARVQCPALKASLRQELTGTMKPKPTVSSAVNLKYDVQCARLHSSAKGAIDHKLALESFTSESFTPYLSIETATQSSISGSVLSQKYSGTASSEANSYLDTKSTRSSLKLEGTSKLDGIWNVEMKENLAGEASVGHIYTLWEHKGENSFQLRGGFSTSGEQSSKVTLELAPWSASTVIQVHARQPSSLFEKASVSQVVSLTASFTEQKASWKGEGHVQAVSLGHKAQLSNDPAEIRLDAASSLEGPVSFLDDVLLPVYDISLWDFLKMDVTNYTNQQSLQLSSSLVYTKSLGGHRFFIPVKEAAHELLIPRPEPRSLLALYDGRAPSPLPERDFLSLAKKASFGPFAIRLPLLPEVRFPPVEVTTEYSPPTESSPPLLGVTVPEFRVTLSPFTLPKRLPFAGATLDLNEAANRIADFDLPTIAMSEQSIRVPALTFWLPAGISVPSFGALAGDLRVASPVYNATWSARLRKGENQLEATLEATCSSTVQPLEYDLRGAKRAPRRRPPEFGKARGGSHGQAALGGSLQEWDCGPEVGGWPEPCLAATKRQESPFS
ncbi:apolipoprotein B-100-like [Gracilinanus agilis]|uniref:apolipoprotein B-100-like n=1 Tax=Gracilinanus agilis TaxID=191870 RepID=UPI001CFD0AED|nr:apolipoprotein B-100-like [Gracilinanus agilis]